MVCADQSVRKGRSERRVRPSCGHRFRQKAWPAVPVSGIPERIYEPGRNKDLSRGGETSGPFCTDNII